MQSGIPVQAARDSTAQGLVLWKNTPSLVPLDPTQRIALIVGPHVLDRHVMLGNYRYLGQICVESHDGCVTSFQEGFQNVTARNQ